MVSSDLREVGRMGAVHCHFCGGIVGDLARIEYRPPRASAQLAMPHEGPCGCSPPFTRIPPGIEPPPNGA